MTEPIDISYIVDELAAKAGLDKTYIREIIITPVEMTYHVYRGRDGLCQGSKYVDPETGMPAMEDPITLEGLA